ncbi:MAG: hypothetical protein GF421_02185 [Candidatus Aminicenantes bacterium]|nr:hypothetical protein [Candidatus Aminicenantes bacterium]
MKSIILVLILFLPGFFPNAEEIARETEQKLRSLTSFKAEFKQVYHSTSVSTPLTEYGNVFYKKPGLMKWSYTKPEKKVILLMENEIQYYFIEDSQLLIQDVTDEEQEHNIMSLFSGQTDLFGDYDVEIDEENTVDKQSHHLKLIPKNDEIQNFILLDIDKKTLFINKATFFDWAGNKQEFEFSRIQTNIHLAEDTFILDTPSDVDIIK